MKMYTAPENSEKLSRISESKKKLEEWTGKEITSFAYPNGSFDGRERQFLKTCGYSIAATVESGFSTAESDAFLLPRNVVIDDGSFTENLCHALGIWVPFVNKLKRLFR